MVIWEKVTGASMFTSNHCPFTCAAPVLQRVFSFPSSALAGAPPPLAEADPTQPARERVYRVPVASCAASVLVDTSPLASLLTPSLVASWLASTLASWLATVESALASLAPPSEP